MSIRLIQRYYAKVEKLIQYGGSRNESSLRKPFQELLDAYAVSKGLLLVSEVEYATAIGGKPAMNIPPRQVEGLLDDLEVYHE
jgi:hypothetical protein